MTTIQQKITTIKEKKQAIILAHNYQRPEIQDIADFVGDSLDLSRMAANTKARVIVFCGVHFMAETAKILSPDKMILLPDVDAGCPMADMVPVEELRKLKSIHPDAVVVSYVNTHADVKAESDYCCTSANGLLVVSAIPDGKKIIFTPDKYLGDYIIKQTGRDMILTDGFCPTHQTITVEGILRLKEKYPQAIVIVHPECNPEIIDIAYKALSTNGMCKYVTDSEAKEFIVGTETGIIHRLKKENPQKQFYPASERTVCPNMKLITMEKLLWALEEDVYQVEVPEDIAEKARMAIERMLLIL
ncbi:MAG: quinolinate synthase NadA [Candidatus Desantisbacteria bacterium]